MENLIYLFIITNRNPHRVTADMIYRMWERNKILREYANPGKEQITLWVREAKQELIERGVKLKPN
jgi:hypothetical protein